MVAAVSSSRRDIQAFHPFLKLNRLLDGIAPGSSPAPDGAPIALQVGEPQNDPPALIDRALAGAAGWQKYPPPRGTDAFRRACTDWLARRYPAAAGLIGPGRAVDPARQPLPLPGTREGLFFAALSAVGGGRDVVLLPNPFYHVYAGAALAAGATPVFVPATAATGFMPDYASLDAATLERTALAFLNSPSNPQGAVAGTDKLARAIATARAHGFVLALDECYAEIYDRAPPPGALDVAAQQAGVAQQAGAAGGGDLSQLLIFHSLSKRSSAAGLRCGFALGDDRLIDALDATLRVGGAGVPLPILGAGAALWQDDAHVEANRARYRANFDAAERALGHTGADVRPQAGFFLWLDVGDGEAAATRLWQEAGLRVLPGAYMGVPDAEGNNPGAPYIRVALVYEPELTEAALKRLGEVIWGAAPAARAG
ncbi:MAG: aminotransferase class I/II-fold pyridoxal phosphate-dependent enzyme [Rhodovibrio sp.]|nr:aminotransferase class I/II-fold pyridoxal phosphate-dependent enzyme [Rhodovibrio sp.]